MEGQEMRNWRWILPLLLLYTFSLSACDNSQAAVASLEVNLHAQETDYWCWAATTQMITEYLGHAFAQCDLAKTRFGLSVCCDDEPSDDTCCKTRTCKKPGWTMFKECNFAFKASAKPLAWEEIKKQIDVMRRPMAYAYAPKTGGIGHVVVINGYTEQGGVRLLNIVDPWEPCVGALHNISYEEYSNGGRTEHWETTYEISWKG